MKVFSDLGGAFLTVLVMSIIAIFILNNVVDGKNLYGDRCVDHSLEQLTASLQQEEIESSKVELRCNILYVTIVPKMELTKWQSSALLLRIANLNSLEEDLEIEIIIDQEKMMFGKIINNQQVTITS